MYAIRSYYDKEIKSITQNCNGNFAFNDTINAYLKLDRIEQQLQSPNGKQVMTFALLKDGTPTYQLSYNGKEVVKPSKLGFELKNDKQSLLDGFVIEKIETNTFNETWKPVWGEVSYNFV